MIDDIEETQLDFVGAQVLVAQQLQLVADAIDPKQVGRYLFGGQGDDTYSLTAESAAATVISDDEGSDTLVLSGLTLSAQPAAPGIAGLARVNTSLWIDVDQDGEILPENDLTIPNFFAGSGSSRGSSTVAQVDNLSDTDILALDLPSLPPLVAVNDDVTTSINQPVVIDPTENDIARESRDYFYIADFDSETAEGGNLILDVNGTDGSVQAAVDDRIVYTPPQNFEGIDTFEYQIIDRKNELVTGTVTITVVGSAPTTTVQVLSTQLRAPFGVAVDDRGTPGNLSDDLYAVAEYGLNPNGAALRLIPTTGGPGFVTSLDVRPYAVGVASPGVYIIVDSAGGISRVQNGIRTPIGTLPNGIAADIEIESPNLASVPSLNGQVVQSTESGQLSLGGSLGIPTGIDTDGTSLFVADQLGSIWEVDPATGMVTLVTDDNLGQAFGLAVNLDGSLLVTDPLGSRLLQILNP